MFKLIGQVETIETSVNSFRGVKCSPPQLFYFWEGWVQNSTALRKIQVGFDIPLRLMPSDQREQKNHALLEMINPVKLTEPLQIGHPKRKLVFQPIICRCYVSFRDAKLHPQMCHF